MDLVNRLKRYMNTQGISSSLFADTCSIPRPTMSQILNGRNKKISDELISKIHIAYPDLSVLWLMFGEGEMITNTNIKISETENRGFPGSTINHNANYQSDTDSSNLLIDDRDFLSSTDESGDTDLFHMKSASEVEKTYNDVRPSGKTYSQHTANATVGHENTNTFIDFRSEVPRPSQEIFAEPGIKSDMTGKRNSIFTDTDTPEKTSSQPSTPYETNTTLQTDTPAPSAQRDIKISTDSGKRITNIVVFYSDNSFQSFYPASF